MKLRPPRRCTAFRWRLDLRGRYGVNVLAFATNGVSVREFVNINSDDGCRFGRLSPARYFANRP